MLENGIMSSSKAQLVASSTALHEYRLQCGFICSNDDDTALNLIQLHGLMIFLCLFMVMIASLFIFECQRL
jgi:hypothetical protein